MKNHDVQTYRLLRIQEALSLTSLRRTAFLEKVRNGEIPAPVRLSAQAVAWRESDLIAWIESRPIAHPRRKAFDLQRAKP